MYEGAATKEQKPAEKPNRTYYSHSTGTIHPCCEQAVRQQCVCQVSWKCPVHGSWCVGSHD